MRLGSAPLNPHQGAVVLSEHGSFSITSAVPLEVTAHGLLIVELLTWAGEGTLNWASGMLTDCASAHFSILLPHL